MEIFYEGNHLIIHSDADKRIVFSYDSGKVRINDYVVSHPGEYEKAGILLEVKEYDGELFYNFIIGSKRIAIVTADSFEIKEEILSFFGDIDVLIIVWSKESVKVFENIEAKVVIPYWEWKDLFLNALWQHKEELDIYKVQWEFDLNNTEFVNLGLKIEG